LLSTERIARDWALRNGASRRHVSSSARSNPCALPWRSGARPAAAARSRSLGGAAAPC
jgi:hypothetical protein